MTQTTTLAPVGAIPTSRQLAWHRNEYYAFVHFGPNTFTGEEWGSGKEPTSVFNPAHLDCMQWCRVFKKAGMAGVIITAKHHDGFCLWPSEFSSHTVAQSPWKHGKGDVLRELSAACHKTGLKFGVYLSPWDRNHPDYGTPEYNMVFENMLEEVLTQYGEIFEVWFDGANGEGPNGKKQVYDWPGFVRVVRTHQPKAVIFSDAGPDVRWVGNEEGRAAETNWCAIERSRYFPGTPLYKELTQGQENGSDWVPAECDVSIRPGWFYKASEDAKVKSPKVLEELYYASVGQNASFLLNVPPGPDGRIHDADIKSLLSLHRRLSATFRKDLTSGCQAAATNVRGVDKRFSADMAVDGQDSTYWATDEGVKNASLTIAFPKPARIDRVMLQEAISLGQRVRRFSIEALVGNAWMPVAHGTTIGYKRILRFQPIFAGKVRLNIDDAKASPAISRIGAFLAPD